jgi:hypothetical protein
MTTKPPDATCSVCGNSSYKKCACPWQKPFQDWPIDLLRMIGARIGHTPSHGS